MTTDPAGAALADACRADGGRILSALVGRYRDLDLAEEALAEAYLRAARSWATSCPADPSAWLYTTASRVALDLVRRRGTRARAVIEPPQPGETAEEVLISDAAVIPEERLRLILICCHPAVAPESRAALTLRLVCGLPVADIAAAFLVSEPTLLQRLTRAKRKIREAGVPFGLPDPALWPERLEAVLSTLEVAYAKAYEDAAGLSSHAGFAAEIRNLSGLLAELMPMEPEVLALAATVRFAEARRAARLDDAGAMIPLDEQNTSLWDRAMIAEADALLRRSARIDDGRPPGPRALLAAIHSAHADRARTGQTSWPMILYLYDALMLESAGPVTAVNRAVALARVHGAEAGLHALPRLEDNAELAHWLPWQVAHAHLLADAGRIADARNAFDAALALRPAPAEQAYLTRRRDRLPRPA